MSNLKEVILVTGANGFVGANLVRKLLELGHEVHVLIRSGVGWRLADIVNDLRVYTVDLRNNGAVQDAVNRVRPEVIFHLATSGIYGGKSAPDAELAETNFIGTINLIDAVKNIEYRCFVNTGSSSEYGLANDIMTESDTCKPANVYAITKLAATQYASFIGKSENKPILTLRLFSPFGPYDESRRLIPYTITQLLKKQILMLGNPKAVRDFIFIEDVVDAYLQCIPRAVKCSGEVFNIGSGIQRSVSDVVESITHIIGEQSDVQWRELDKERPWEPALWQADITKARHFLDWRPKGLFEGDLSKTIHWMKENLNYYS